MPLEIADQCDARLRIPIRPAVRSFNLATSAALALGEALRPRRVVWRAGFALTFVLLAVLLFADRDAAPIFGRYGIGDP